MADIKLEFEGDLGSAARANAELLSQFREFDESLKNVARSADKTKKATKDAMDQTGKSAKDAKAQVGSVRTELSGSGVAASTAASQVGGWVKSFLGISSVLGTLKAVTAEIRLQQQLQADMLAKAVDLDKLSQGLASIKTGGLTPRNVESARNEIQKLALDVSADLPTAQQSLFFGYSALGDTEAGRAAARVSAKVAVAGQLQPDQVKALPGLFSVIGADTEEQQTAVVSQLLGATKASIAEPATYMPEFVQNYPAAKQGGLSYQESLALMNASILTSAGNVAEAGTRMTAAIRYTGLSPSPEAEKYLTQEGKKRGVNFADMQPRERFFLAREVYQQKLAENNITEFTGVFGAKAMQGIGGLFSPEAETEYERALGIVQSTDPQMVMRDFEGYQQTLPARQTEKDVKKAVREAQAGRIKENASRYNQMVGSIIEYTKATGTPKELLSMALMPEMLERKGVGDTLITEGLQAAKEAMQRDYPDTFPDEPRYLQLTQLQKQRVGRSPFNTEFLGQAYEATQGFADLKDMQPRGASFFDDAIVRYFQNLETALKENTEEMKKQREATEKNSETIRQRSEIQLFPGHPMPQGIFE